MSKLEELEKALKELREQVCKDELDDKIKTKLKTAMAQRGFGEADATRHIIDRDRGEVAPKPEKPLLQSEAIKFDSNGQWQLDKSNYGPKGAGLYQPHVNQERKANNTGDVVADAGKNVNVKSWTTTSSSMGNAASAAEAARQAAANKVAPVKVYTDEEKKAFAEKRLKKSFPEWTAEEYARANAMGNAPKQATDEEMFGRFAVSEEQAELAKGEWDNTFNGFYEAGQQPIEKSQPADWGNRGPIKNEVKTAEEERISSIWTPEND